MSVAKLLSSRKNLSYDPIEGLVSKVSQITTSRTFNDEKIAEFAIAAESADSNAVQVLTNVYNNLESTIKNIAEDFDISLESHQLEAASIAGIFAANPKAFLTNKPKINVSNAMVIRQGVPDSYMERPSIALEAYDERENRNAQLFTIIYNLLASRQDDFGETFFPTIVVNPNEVGVTVSAKLFYVYNDFKRSVTGALANYGRKNVIRAYADAEILKNELTRAVPVLRVGGADDNTAVFVPTTEVPSWSVALGNGITVPTGALKVGTKVDLIGISQTDELLNSGLMGPSDTLDTYIKLEKIYLKLTDGTNTDIIEVVTENLPDAVFTYAPQGNYRRMVLDFNTDSIILGPNTTTVTGGALSYLTEATNNKIRIAVSLGGSVTLDKGDCNINGGTVSLVAVRDLSDQLVTGAGFNTIKAKIDTAEIIGYTLIAYRANSNIRQRGQLLDSQIEYRIFSVPYRSPISVIMPVAGQAGDENAALQTLITTTGIRVSNEAVTTLLKAQQSLASYVPVADANGDLPQINAIGHFYVRPTYFQESLDLSNVVDSLKSHERIKDIRAALVEKIRYYANEMYRLSEYKAAALVLTGNQAMKPTVIVGTDPVLYNYIMADGDLRTLGDTFDVKVVSTLDKRVSGKIFVTFGVFDASRNNTINPLNFGNMLYSPELVVNLNVSRDGQTSKELLVSPRFVHIVNLPVLTVLDVTGLPTVVNKVQVNMRNV